MMAIAECPDDPESSVLCRTFRVSQCSQLCQPSPEQQDYRGCWLHLRDTTALLSSARHVVQKGERSLEFVVQCSTWRLLGCVMSCLGQ